MFPHPGNCLWAWKDKDQSHSMENKHQDPINGGNSSVFPEENHPGEDLLSVYSPELVQTPAGRFLKHFQGETGQSGQEVKEKTAGSPSFPWEVALGGLCPFLKAAVFVGGDQWLSPSRRKRQLEIPIFLIPAAGGKCQGQVRAGRVPLVQICSISSKKASAPLCFLDAKKPPLVVGSRRD